MYSYLIHAHALRPLSDVVLGLDNYHLGSAPSAQRPDFDPEVLYGPGKNRLRRFITGDLRIATTYATLVAGIEMWSRQQDIEPEWFASDGQRLGDVFFRRAGEEYVVAGPRAYFDAIDRLEVGFQTDAGTARPPPRGVAVAEPDPDESSIGYVRRIVAFCRSEGINLRIFITPSHVHQLEIATASGAWPALEQGKRSLARLLAMDAASHPGLAPIPAWDFSGYSSVTEETLPPDGSHAEMLYYWDSSHFKAIVGDYVLDRLFDAGGIGAPPSDFGVRVSVQTIDHALVDDRNRQAAYEARHLSEVAELRALVAAARARERHPAYYGPPL
jgi:hypothetical protein